MVAGRGGRSEGGRAASWGGGLGVGVGGGTIIPNAPLSPAECRVKELCESRGGRPVLSVLTSLTVQCCFTSTETVDVKQH